MARFSVLDLVTVPSGTSPSQALADATAYAQRAEALGYHRYWVAEHHGMAGVASSAPAVVLAQIGASTTSIRIGAGGVMLPNHAPLVIAEQFGTLEALHPGRVDLGLGRAPGTDAATARALGRYDADSFPEQVVELASYFTGTSQVLATPARGLLPELWLLGSSTYSAQLAGHLGLPFSFAYHFAPELLDAALEAYRSRFTPSALLEAPKVMVAVSVLCAQSTEEAQFLARPSHAAMLSLRQGRPTQLEAPEVVAARAWSEAEASQVAAMAATQLIGDQTLVAQGIEQLLERTSADELLVSTRCYAPSDRLASLELVAQLERFSERSVPV